MAEGAEWQVLKGLAPQQRHRRRDRRRATPRRPRTAGSERASAGAHGAALGGGRCLPRRTRPRARGPRRQESAAGAHQGSSRGTAGHCARPVLPTHRPACPLRCTPARPPRSPTWPTAAAIVQLLPRMRPRVAGLPGGREVAPILPTRSSSSGNTLVRPGQKLPRRPPESGVRGSQTARVRVNTARGLGITPAAQGLATEGPEAPPHSCPRLRGTSDK